MPQNLIKKADKFYAKRYLKPLGIKGEDLGQVVGQGLFHIVFAYKNDLVIKVPIKPPQKKSLIKKAISDEKLYLKVISKYFKKNTPQTEIIQNKKGTRYAIVQKQINGGRPISAKEAVSKKFLEVTEINKVMVQETGYSLDYLGLAGLKNCLTALLTGNMELANMTNILYKNGSIHIVDTNLLNLRFERGVLDTVFTLRDITRFTVSRILIKLCFKINS